MDYFFLPTVIPWLRQIRSLTIGNQADSTKRLDCSTLDHSPASLHLKGVHFKNLRTDAGSDPVNDKFDDDPGENATPRRMVLNELGDGAKVALS